MCLKNVKGSKSLVNVVGVNAAKIVFAALVALVLVDRASGAIPNPVVTGPVAAHALPGDPSHDYPFFSTTSNLAKFGYVEEEFFFEGTANRYNLPSLGNGSVIDTGHHYRTRMIVRRPASPARFNGTVLMEWQNVFAGYDFDLAWVMASDHFIRRGYAWVGVSCQRASVHQAGTGLKAWSPNRYGTLDVSDGGSIPDDALSYDIYSQAAQAVRSAVGVSPMGPLSVRRVFAVGVSQAAIRGLAPYYNSIQSLSGAFDGFLLIGGGGVLRTDVSVKAFKLLSETDVAIGGNQVGVSQPDSDHFRTWEVAGAAHLDHWFQQAVFPLQTRDGVPQIPDNPPCTNPPFSRVPYHFALNAAIDHMLLWVNYGMAPAGAPGITADAGSPTLVARDSYGNALGGIRLPQHAIPTAVNTGVNSPPAPSACRFFGSYQPFDQQTLDALYRNHGSYVSAVTRSAVTNLLHGFLVLEDAIVTVQEAAQSDVGKP